MRPVGKKKLYKKAKVRLDTKEGEEDSQRLPRQRLRWKGCAAQQGLKYRK